MALCAPNTEASTDTGFIIAICSADGHTTAKVAKYPVLALYQEFFRQEGALATLMSGSGSTTFALAADQAAAQHIRERFAGRFGSQAWVVTVPLGGLSGLGP